MSSGRPAARSLAPSTAALRAALELIGEPIVELAVAANPARRRTKPRVDDVDPYLEWFDSVCGQLPYGRVQEGDDLVRFAGESRGLHVTDSDRRGAIERCGLGIHPGRSHGSYGGIEEHEPLYWACLYLRPEDALRVDGLVDRRAYQEAAQVAEEALWRDHPDLKVVWFYPARRGARGTSKYRGEGCTFDLEAVGDWLAKHAEEVHSFDDRAGGHAVAWIGPNIPPAMLTWE